MAQCPRAARSWDWCRKRRWKWRRTFFSSLRIFRPRKCLRTGLPTRSEAPRPQRPRTESLRDWYGRSWKQWQRRRQRRAAEALRRSLGHWRLRLGRWSPGFRGERNRKRRTSSHFPERSTTCGKRRTSLPRRLTATPKRTEAVEKATKGAAEVPLQVAERTVALFERLGQLEGIVAASMRSDLQVAGLLAEAAARGALANVEINLDGLKDAAYVAATRAKTAALKERLGNAPRARSA